MSAEAAGSTTITGLLAWIEAETGLHFPEVHTETIERNARSRAEACGLDPADYALLLRTDAAESQLFFDTILIGETYFFRDERQFAALLSTVLPALLAEERPLRLWSATCATGEEALSLLAVLEEARANSGATVPCGMLASDLNLGALAHLAEGRYSSSSFRSDGRLFHPLLDRLGERDAEGGWSAFPGTIERIERSRLNIAVDSLPPAESMDLVFCRNTLLYMRQDRKEAVLERLAATIRPGGFLFLASPEVPLSKIPSLETLEAESAFFFRKRATRRVVVSAHPEAPRGRRGQARPGSPSGGPRPVVPATPRPRSSEPAIPKGCSGSDLAAGLALASARFLGSDGMTRNGVGDSVEAVAEALGKTVAAIQANRFSEAEELLDRFESWARENHVSQHLRALCLKHRGELSAALELWERARLYEPSFWPALFQAGLAYETVNPARGAALLGECLEMIDARSADASAYALVLEGFQPPHYRRMAERLLHRMGGTDRLEA